MITGMAINQHKAVCAQRNYLVWAWWQMYPTKSNTARWQAKLSEFQRMLGKLYSSIFGSAFTCVGLAPPTGGQPPSHEVARKRRNVSRKRQGKATLKAAFQKTLDRLALPLSGNQALFLPFSRLLQAKQKRNKQHTKHGTV